MPEKNFKWMPILKTGSFTAKNGKKVTFDHAALDKVIKNTDLSKEPQFVIEHPEFDKLGFGTIEQLKRVGDYLFALPKKVEEKFKEAVNSGVLPGRSVRLDGETLALSSIGFLPKEVAPAVDGLGVYSFSSDATTADYQFSLPGVESHFAEVADDKYEFEKFEVSQWPFNSIKILFRSIKNSLIETFGLEKANEIMNDYTIEETGNPPILLINKDGNFNFSQNTNGEKMKIDLSKYDLSKPDQAKAVVTALQAENQELENNLTAKTIELQKAQSTLTAQEQAAARKEVLDFCESPEMKLKISPAEKETVVAQLLAAKAQPKLEFSNGATKVELSPYDLLKEQLKQLPDKIELQELAKNDVNGNQNVSDYVREGKEMAELVNPKK